jgi:hypothetical protein
MGRGKALVSLICLAPAVLPAAAGAAEPGTAPDCRFDGARGYRSFGRIHVFTRDRALYGCLTDVGRAYRLERRGKAARSSAARRPIFGVGDWIGFATATGRVRARNLRTGAAHGTGVNGPVSSLVVNFDGTLAWIAGTGVHAKPAAGTARTLGSDAAIDRRFLGLENDQGCAVTWRVGGEQRSSSIYCSHP